MPYQTVLRKAVIQGTTPRLTFQIVNEDDVGFQPDTLTMSIYDHVCTDGDESNTLIRDDADILANCDIAGNVTLFLTVADTTIADLEACEPHQVERRLLFTWTWDSPDTKVGKHEAIITIAADFETVAT